MDRPVQLPPGHAAIVTDFPSDAHTPLPTVAYLMAHVQYTFECVGLTAFGLALAADLQLLGFDVVQLHLWCVEAIHCLVRLVPLSRT